jgi:UDP-N-acetylmuramyl pentapeptide phosphotransferase/UDP-N-acetylglucosamine-1-phosphate transferase
MLAANPIVGLAVLLLSYLGVRLTITLAHRFDVYDISNERSSHQGKTPRGGGAVIVVLTLTGLFVSALLDASPFPAYLAGYLCSALCIAVISLVDDLRPLPSVLRLAGHVAMALVSVYFSGYPTEIEFTAQFVLPIGYFGILLAVIWIVGVTNIYNFMDGIDGIAGAQAVIAAVGWILIGRHIGSELVQGAGLLLAASSLGFLLHNWSPAKIFMGDVGSAFLGFSFAQLPFLAIHSRTIDHSFSLLVLCGALLLWPFLLDGATTIVRRALKGENVLKAHRSHAYQRLIIAGKKHGPVATLYAWLALTGIPLAWICLSRSPFAIYVCLAVLVALYGAVLFYARHCEILSARKRKGGAANDDTNEPVSH